jgi:uncharacterized RDD family membrane protein YckC
MENIDQILDAPQAEAIRLEYAGFWIRTGAYLVDALILFAANFVIGLATAAAIPQVVGSIVSLILGASYFALMEASEYQATLGKMAFGIKVGDQNGDQISVANAIGRYFAKIISGLILFIGFMMVGWDEKNQGLHDKLASTFVFYKH